MEGAGDQHEDSKLRKSLSVLTIDAFRSTRSSRSSGGGSRAGAAKFLAEPPRRDYAPLPTGEAEQVNEGDYALDDLVEDDWSSLYLRWKRGDFTIVPEGNLFLDVWDILVITNLVLTALVLPFDVALYDEEPEILSGLMRLVDAMFLLDILLTFNVAYAVTTTTNTDMFERAPLKIARRYMAFPFSDRGAAGWFWGDLLTLIPWDEFGNSKDFILLRLLRLSRMFRLVRVFKLFTKWQMHFGYSISLLNSVRTVLATLTTCHWMACAWAHLAIKAEEAEDGAPNWLRGWLERHQPGRSVGDVTPLEVYNLSLYWCISTLTSVGYGDVLPQNQLEVILLSITMVVLGSFWAWVLAHMVSTLQNMDVFAAESHQLMDDLNLLMKHRRLEPGLQQRCRKHLLESFHVHRQRHQQRTVKWLSAGLQGEIAVESGVDKACSCIYYLRNIEKPVLIAIAQRFIGDIFSPNEYIHIRYSVAVIRKGTCIKRRKLLTRDDVIGEDMILATEYLMDYMAPKSLTFVEVMTLSRSDLVTVCESHPGFDRRLRKAQIKLALWRAIVLEADARKRGKVSMLQQQLSLTDTTSAGAAAGRRVTFSQSIGEGGFHRNTPPQESIAGVVEQLGGMRRRMEDTHGTLLKELSVLSGHVDEVLDRAGLPKRRAGLPFCGRQR